jgi:hypothetical protein
MRTFIRVGLITVFLAVAVLLCGCGGNSQISCAGSVTITVSPTSATANHAAMPQANQVQFIAVGQPTAPPGCPIPEWVATVYGTWSNPDPTDVMISSANDPTNGTAVCLAPTNGAMTLTGTFSQLVTTPVTKSVQLTCE